MDYSLFSGGQYFDNLKFLASFDKAYRGSGNKRLRLLILPVASYTEALKKTAELKRLPVACYERSYVRLGDKLKIDVIGDFDFVESSKQMKNWLSAEFGSADCLKNRCIPFRKKILPRATETCANGSAIFPLF